MGLFDDNPFVSIKPGHATEPPPAGADELARGSFWTLYLRSGQKILAYVSGELAGRQREVVISEDEAQRICDGDDDTAKAVLLEHGVG